MNCIICDKIANAKGSHIVPASLIKNCVGKHYNEESYEIDSNNSSINTYFGRDNLKNTSTEIKQNHYKRDFVLCQKCEDKLAKLESEIAVNFLQKFREEKYSNNFEELNLENGFEIIIPKKTSNKTFLAYFYSIILRECKILEIEDNMQILSNEETENIKKFVLGYLYNEDNNNAIENYKLVIIFDKYCNKGSYVTTSNEFEKPYLFYFCEAIIQLFTSNPYDLGNYLFKETFNDIKQTKSKILVGPKEFYATLRNKMAEKLADTFMTKGILKICELNGKSYDENFIEYQNFIENSKEQMENKMIALNKLIEKYGG
jgi:hypothetical protein